LDYKIIKADQLYTKLNNATHKIIETKEKIYSKEINLPKFI